MLKLPLPNIFSNWSNISSKPIEKGLSELNIDRSLLVIISSFVSKVNFEAPLGDFDTDVVMIYEISSKVN
tara:strand:- start:111 stop:320 length:210 start_codon:yes stop_codon:yes gene_type:complete